MSWISKKQFIICLVFLCRIAGAEERPYGCLDVIKVENHIVIDGILDEWSQVNWIRIAEGASFVSGNEFNSLSDDGDSEPLGTALTDADLSSEISLQWDEEYLYLAAKVIDNVRDLNPTAHESVWYLRDAVTLFLDVPKDGDGAQWRSGDHSFSFTADDKIKNWWRHGDVTGHRELPMPSSVRSVVVHGNEGNYSLEAAIPMKILREFTPDWIGPFAGKEMGFLLLLTDMDGINAPVVAQLMYGGDGDHDGTWSTLRLVDDGESKLLLRKGQGRLRGQVVSATDDSNWKDGDVHIVSIDGNGDTIVSVDSSGYFETVLPVGEYRVGTGGNSVIVSVMDGEVQDEILLKADPTLIKIWFPEKPTAELIDLYENLAIPIISKTDLTPLHINRMRSDRFSGYLFEIDNIKSFRKAKNHIETSMQWRKFSAKVLGELGVKSGSLFSVKTNPTSHNPLFPIVYLKDMVVSERFIKAGSGAEIKDWRLYGIPDGLNQQRVKSIAQTSEGNLWFAAFANRLSNGSTVVYDGEYFREVLFDENSYGGIVSIDSEDNVWISGIIQDGTGWQFSLRIYDGRQWVSAHVPQQISSSGITVIHNSSDGSTWLGTSHGVIKCFQNTMQLFTTDYGLLSNGVISILSDSKGKVWFGTLNGVSVYDGYQFINYTAADGLSNEKVRVITEDYNGRIWLGTDGGLFSYHNDNINFFGKKSGLPEIPITALNVDQNGIVWVGTDGGIYRNSVEESGVFELIDGVDEVLDLFQDGEGFLWTGTNEGMARYKKSRTREITEREGIPSNDISHLVSDGKGTVIFASKNYLSKFVNNKIDVELISVPGEIRSLEIDRSGTEWIVTKQGVFYRKDGDWVKSNSIGSSHMFETALIEDDDHRLWHQSQYGINYLTGNGQWEVFDSGGFFEGEGFGLIPGLLSGNNGLLWFRGVPKRNKNFVVAWDGSAWKSFDEYSESPESRPTCGLQTSKNTVWFGTEKEGLYKFSDGKFTRFSVEGGMAPPFITSIMQDKKGRLWLSSQGGGLTVFDGNSSQTISKKDGLLSNVVTGVIEDSQGSFWIATNNGISIYSPSNRPPPVRIVDVIADNRYEYFSDIRIPSTQELISIRFKGTSFKTRSERMKYYIRLLDETHSDTSWTTVEENNYEFANLPTGKYIFEVKAIDRDLNYSQEAAKVEFEVVYVPETSSIGLGEIELHDIYASFYKTYGLKTAGKVQVFNKNEREIEATLHYYLPELMARPTIKRFVIPPRTKLILPFKAHLDNSLLNLIGKKIWEADVKLSYDIGDQTFSVEKKIPLQIYGRGTLTWEAMDKAAAFVTPEHEPVVALARGLLASFDESNIKHITNRNIMRSMLMFEGLNSLGVKYAPDANTPFSEALNGNSALDNIQYPYELMQSLLGDCDDNTVLYCSLLENLNISTAFIDVPGHILMMFDSGIPSDRHLGAFLPISMFVDYRGSLWVPIEVTVLGEDRLFMDAWELGAKIVQENDIKDPDSFTIVSEAWLTYPYGDIEKKFNVDVPSGEFLRKSLRENLNRLELMRDEYFEKTYVTPLLKNAHDDSLRMKMAMAHIESNRFRLALSQLPLISNDLKSEAFYLMGYSYAGLENYELAAEYVEKAISMDPNHTGYMESLCWIYHEILISGR